MGEEFEKKMTIREKFRRGAKRELYVGVFLTSVQHLRFNVHYNLAAYYSYGEKFLSSLQYLFTL